MTTPARVAIACAPAGVPAIASLQGVTVAQLPALNKACCVSFWTVILPLVLSVMSCDLAGIGTLGGRGAGMLHHMAARATSQLQRALVRMRVHDAQRMTTMTNAH